ncbi:hypothetical protein ACOSQ4_004435 [Xanthoceras sorbifolium]
MKRRVCDFLMSGDWNFNLPCEHIPFDIVTHIISIHAGRSDSGKDRRIWGLSKDGNFTVKTAFKLISADHNAGIWKWRKIWSLKVPPKITCFYGVCVMVKFLRMPREVLGASPLILTALGVEGPWKILIISLETVPWPEKFGRVVAKIPPEIEALEVTSPIGCGQT